MEAYTVKSLMWDSSRFSPRLAVVFAQFIQDDCRYTQLSNIIHIANIYINVYAGSPQNGW